MLCRIYKELIFDGEDFSGYRIYIAYLFYFVTEKLNAHRKRLIRRIKLNHVTANSECPSLEINIISGVLYVS